MGVFWPVLALGLVIAQSFVLADNQPLPGTPRKFQRVSVTWTSFNISWQPPDQTSSGPVSRYLIEVYDPAANSKTYATHETTLSVQGLQPGNLYSLQIFAVNNAGKSINPLKDFVTTPSDTPRPDAPVIQNERSGSYWQTQINLTWSTPEGRGLPVLRYMVWKREWKYGTESSQLKIYKTVPFGINHLIIPLTWDSNYHFAVEAANQFKVSHLEGESIIAFTVTKGPLGTDARVPRICQDILTYQHTLSPYGSFQPYIDTVPEVLRDVFNSTVIPFIQCSESAQWYLCAKYFPRIDQTSGTRLPPCRSYCVKFRKDIWPCWYGAVPRMDDCRRLPGLRSGGRANCQVGPRNASEAPSCPYLVTGNESSYGVRHWPLTRPSVYARLHCPFGPDEAYAYRKCLLSGVWGRENVSACRVEASKTHQSLKNLSKVVVTEDNLQEVSKELLDLTKVSVSLESNDLSEVADILENIVDNGNQSLSSIGEDLIQIVNNLVLVNHTTLVHAQQRFQSSARIVKALEKYTEIVPLSGNDTLQFESENVIIRAVDTSSIPLSGLMFGTAYEQPHDEPKGDPAKASIKIPHNILDSVQVPGQTVQRVAFVEYFKSTLFKTSQYVDGDENAVNGHVISASIRDTKLTNLKTPVEMVFYPPRTPSRGSCVFWDFQALEGSGGWSTDGCFAASRDAEKTVCHCNHMTNFAVLMDVDPRGRDGLSHNTKVALSLITYIGCGLSVVGLTLTLVTLLVFRELRSKTPNRILISLCLSLLLVLLVFLIGVERTEVAWVCRCVAVLLHYFILVTFSWMAVEALNMYLLFVKVMPTKTTHFFLKCSVVAWGLPAIIVAITAATSNESYGGEDICRITGVPFYAVFLLPVLLIILFNFVVFVMVQRSLSSSKSVLTADKKSAGRQNFRRATAIAVLLGLTWVFGVFAVKDAKLIFQYLFCIFNAFQGFFIFLFYCLLQPSLRRRWRHCLTGQEEPAKCDAKMSRSSNYIQNLMDRSRNRSGSNTNSTSKSSTQGMLGTKV